jgi:hypothetical protein
MKRKNLTLTENVSIDILTKTFICYELVFKPTISKLKIVTENGRFLIAVTYWEWPIPMVYSDIDCGVDFEVLSIGNFNDILAFLEDHYKKSISELTLDQFHYID